MDCPQLSGRAMSRKRPIFGDILLEDRSGLGADHLPTCSVYPDDMTRRHTELNDATHTLSEADLQAISQRIPVRTYPRGTVLLREGEIAREAYFVIKGCVRAYYLVDGEERSSDFFTEDQSAAALDSYNRQIPSTHFLDCIEDCTLSVLTYTNEQQLIREFPGFGAICQQSMQTNYGRHQERLSAFVTMSPEERYQHLLRDRPDLLHRVPQYQLASYLGIQPESLSRIRKRLAKT